MRRFRKFMLGLLAAGVVSFLVIPLLIPESSSGIKTNFEAAGKTAEFVEIESLEVHIQRSKYIGDCNCKPPLFVLLHGFGASTFSWRDVIVPLSKFGDVLAYDRPAFGFTERPTEWSEVNPYGFEGNFNLLAGLLAKFGESRKVILVGHSAGGQLAAEFARLNPAKVSALILVDPAILTTGGGPEGLDWLYQIPQIAKLGPILVSSIASSGEEILRKSFYNQDLLTQKIYEGYRAPLKVKGWEKAFWHFATAPRKNQLAANLTDLTTPTLLITGDTDLIVPTEDTIRLNTLITNSKLEVIAQAGHLPHEEKPKEFMAAIERHLGELVR